MATIFSVTALVSGHSQAQAVAKNQPAKMAALEGHYETGTGGTPLYLLGSPDSDSQDRQVHSVSIPGGLSFLIHGNWHQAGVGSRQDSTDSDRPPVWLPFQAYHLMVALGMLFIGMTWSSLVLCSGAGSCSTNRWMLRAFVIMALGPIVSQSGWLGRRGGRPTTLGRLRFVAHCGRRFQSCHRRTCAHEHHPVQPDLPDADVRLRVRA